MLKLQILSAVTMLKIVKRSFIWVFAVLLLSPITAFSHGNTPFSTPGVIHACRLPVTGVLRKIDSGNCLSNETVLHWQITGPQGILGPQGVSGSQGPPGEQGTAGVAGSQGPVGPQGQPGAPGQSVNAIEDLNNISCVRNGTSGIINLVFDTQGLVRLTCVVNSPAVCGNSTIDASEQCDDGNTMNGDGCSSTCSVEQPTICGNGIVEASEQCDDGNTMNGDGCSSTCSVEQSTICTNGETRTCYSGPPSTRDVGQCRAGTMTCSLGAFGSCVSEVLPELVEICGNGVDDNCNGLENEGC